MREMLAPTPIAPTPMISLHEPVEDKGRDASTNRTSSRLVRGLAGKKILFVITKSNWGGAQSYVYTLATQAKNAGADVAVATGGTGLPGAEPGLLVTNLQKEGVRIIFVPSFARDISLVQEWSAYIELVRLLRKECPDVLHLNSSKAAGLGALAGRIAGIQKIIFTAHGWPHREPRPFWQRLLIWKLSWFTTLLSHVVIVVSKSDYHASPVLFSRRNIHLIRNGLAPFALMARREVREKIHACGSFWFLMIAELHKNKGVDIALRALARIHKKYPEASLVLMGGGEEAKALKKLAEELEIAKEVTFAGFVPDARTYLLGGDCFLLPSRKEGLPFSLLQAGIAHLPMIATNVGGIPEVIENEKTGLLIHSENVEELARAMEQMIENSEKRIALGDALYERVTTHFSEAEMVQKTFALY